MNASDRYKAKQKAMALEMNQLMQNRKLKLARKTAKDKALRERLDKEIALKWNNTTTEKVEE